MKYIYAISLECLGETYYKIGHTDTENTGNRFKGFKKYNFKILKTWNLEENLCLYLEMLVHNKFKHLSADFPDQIYGKTEIYSDLSEIIIFLDNKVNMSVNIQYASLNSKGYTSCFKPIVDVLLKELEYDKRKENVVRGCVSFWVYNYFYALSNGYTHLKFRMGRSNDKHNELFSHATLVLWTEELCKLGYLDVVSGSGYTTSIVSFTEKFLSIVFVKDYMFKSLIKSDLSEYHRKLFYP